MTLDSIRFRPVLQLLAIAGAVVLASLVYAPPASAGDVDFGVRGGAYSDEDQAFLGGEVLFGMDSDQRWYGNPNVEHVFLDTGGLTTYSFDFHYDFTHGSPYTIWAGGGPTLIRRNFDVPDTLNTTEAGVNLLVGVGATQGKVRPYGQLKVIVSDDTEAVAGVGIRF
jgi:hypothetical protein